MLTGWIPRFKARRPLDDWERGRSLPLDRSQRMSPDDSIGMVKFNSTFLEFVDRTFKIKGMAHMLANGLGFLFFIVFLPLGTVLLWDKELNFASNILPALVFAPICLGGAVLFWWLYLRHDAFQYKYYPVRFNCRTRKIYVFRHNGPDGVLTIPWGNPYAYFHIGQGKHSGKFYDLRCHLLDSNGEVRETFTVGHFWDHENRVRETWELIRRYMQDGPADCFDHPGDRVITLSTRMSWENAWLMVCLMMGTNLYPLRWNLMFPVYGLLTLSRWLTMKSCRSPVFPPEIEAECAIDPDDRYRLPEPSFMAEFAEDEMIYARSEERLRERQRWE